MGRAYERWGSAQRLLARIVFLSVRDALNSCPHPDSKRQARRKRRDLERHGARVLKQSNVCIQVEQKTRKRREIKLMRARIKKEQEEFAKTVAARLLGRKHAA